MPPQSKYPSPEIQLSRIAREARRQGHEFELLWTHAVRQGRANVLTSTPEARVRELLAEAWPLDGEPLNCIRWPSDSGDRITWQGAIYESCEGWRRAYANEPPLLCDLALVRLRPIFDRMRAMHALDSGEATPEQIAAASAGLAAGASGLALLPAVA